MPPHVACIGACHVDATAFVPGRVRMGTSNPAAVSRHVGGVATNVARVLAALGIDVVMASGIGGDAAGDHLVAVLEAEGVGIGGLARRDAATASYTAVVDDAGELVMGIADMAVYDTLDGAWVTEVLPHIAPAAVWIVDANLPVPALEAVLDAAAGRTVVGDPVSVAKASRFVGRLDRFDLVFPDLAELAVLAGTEAEPGAMLELLPTRRGAVVTLGADGVVVRTDAGSQAYPAIPPDRIVDPTGAGDALLAGWMAAEITGSDPIAWGLAAASLTVEVRGAVPLGLDRAAIGERARRS